MPIIKKLITILLISLSVIITFICVLGFLIAFIPAQMSDSHTNKIVKLYFEDVGYSSDVFKANWEARTYNYIINSTQGHSIPVELICPDGNYQNKTIILVHWHEANHEAMYPIAEVFLDKGWNVALYDQRAHGQNTAKTVTFGLLESQDLKEVIDFIYQEFKTKTIGALGQSMGASTIAYYSGTEHAKQYLDFAVIDSGFSNMYDEIHWEISKSKFPLPTSLLSDLGSTFCKLIYGYNFSDINITDQIRSNKIPTIVMHSTHDNKCPYFMGEELYNNIGHSKKNFITFTNSEHLFIFWDNREQYLESIFSFINSFVEK